VSRVKFQVSREVDGGGNYNRDLIISPRWNGARDSTPGACFFPAIFR
jgi:hypothetical protein